MYGGRSNDSEFKSQQHAEYQHTNEYEEKARAVIENVKQIIENTCGKKCLGLTDADAQYISQNILSNDNFRKTVKQNTNNLQFYFFPKIENNYTKDYIAIIYKHNNENNFATTYFSVLI
ncbi:hypothetical protein ABK040_010129 [Willaertia magna]